MPTPPADAWRRRIAIAGLVAVLALAAVVLLQWSTGLVLLTPALIAVLIVTWYSGLWPGLVAFLVVASASPVLMALPIGADYSSRDYLVTTVVATPLALLAALLVHRGRVAIVSLRASEDRFESFMRNLPGSAWIKDPAGRYVYANDESLRVLRRDRSSLYGQTDAALFPPAVAEALHGPDAPAIAGREPVQSVETFRGRDGTRHFLVVRFPISEEGGEVAFLGAVGFDITDRAEAQRQLAERTAQLQLVVDSMPAYVAYIDAERRIVTANRPLAREWFGQEPEAVRGRLVAEIEGPEVYAAMGPHIARALAGEAIDIEIQLPDRSGTLRWFESRFLPNVQVDGTVAGFSALTLDITARKHAEAERGLLATLTERLNRTLNSDDTAVALVSALVPSFVDGAALFFAGDGDGGDVRGVVADGEAADAAATYHLDGEAASGVTAVLRSGQAEYYRVTPEDLPLPERADGAASRLASPRGRASTMLAPVEVEGRVAAVLAVWTAAAGRTCEQNDFDLLREVARRAGPALGHALLYEETLRIAEELRVANSAKDEFLGTVSHELRTPITIVLGNASLLASRHRQMDDATISASLDDLLGQAERLHRVVENMLLLSQLERGARVDAEPFVIASSVSEAIREAQRQQPGRVIRLESDDWSMIALGSGQYVHQVLVNYLQNASRFSDLGEPIEVTVRRAADAAEVRVLDRGIGLSGEDLEAMFAPFYHSERVPAESRGIGIGLTASKRLIEAIGGRVWALPRDGGGAEFGFALPLAGRADGNPLDDDTMPARRSTAGSVEGGAQTDGAHNE